jgi:hypothetical protein
MREDYGPVVPVRTQLRIAPWFLLAVVLYGYCTDHHVRSVQGFVVAVVSDLSGVTQRAGRPPADASRTAKADIPRAYLATYQRAARACPGLPWAVLAGIGKVETNHGRGWAPDWTRRAGIARGTENFAGAGGPMQFLAGTWSQYGHGGDRWDYRDAIPAAARLLCANGAKGGRDLRGAIYAYNHAGWYVDQVLANARRYQAGGR